MCPSFCSDFPWYLEGRNFNEVTRRELQGNEKNPATNLSNSNEFVYLKNEVTITGGNCRVGGGCS